MQRSRHVFPVDTYYRHCLCTLNPDGLEDVYSIRNRGLSARIVIFYFVLLYIKLVLSWQCAHWPFKDIPQSL